MGKGGNISAPAPDPAIGAAALKQAQTGEDMLAFMRDAYGQQMERQDVTDALSADVTRDQLATSRQQQAWAKEDRARYQGVFQPLQDEYISAAKDWDSPERQAQLAAEARADVTSNASLQQKAGNRAMAAAGVNPASGRYQGVNRMVDLTTGLAAAGAENTARNTVRNQALALKESAINLGNGLPVSASNSAAMGVSAGSTALGTNMAANGQAMNATNLMSQGFQGAMSGYQGQASTLNSLYSNQLQGWSAGQQAGAQKAQGIGSAVGGIASIAVMM